MSHHHFMDVCSCGVTLRQCRCLFRGGEKTRTVIPKGCFNCAAHASMQPRQLTLADQHLVEDVITALRAEGMHHYLLSVRLHAALAEAALLRGDHARATRHSQERAELERAGGRIL